MPSFELYKSLYGRSTNGEARKKQTENNIEYSWDEDLSSCIGYFYDYYHDDEPEKNYDLHPENSKTKIPVDMKFMISSYQSINKDDVDFRIMFKPSQNSIVPYYNEAFKRIESDEPVGLYVDIKDEKGKWRKWLVIATADRYQGMFPQWSVLPCDYRYQWVNNRKKYQMWGVSRSQNSYNSGLWRDYRIQSIENQTKFILPYNDISRTVFYNQRIIVSPDLPIPICWLVSKVEGLAHPGTIVYTLIQDYYDPVKDYIERDKNGLVIGMWADYYSLEPSPEDELPNKPDNSNRITAEITYSGNYPQIKIGGSYKKFNVNFYNEKVPIELLSGNWYFTINNEDVSDLLDVVYDSSIPNQIKVKFLGNDEYIGSMLNISYVADIGVSSYIECEIISL